MSVSVESSKEKIISAICTLWQKGYLAAGDGNFSFKSDDDEIWITPSGVRKCELNAKDFVNLRSSNKASSESLMHQAVYETTESAKFVFHAHPPTAIAYSISNDDEHLPENYISELVLSAGRIPIVPYARPGSYEMGENLKPYVKDSRIMILKHHGALTWGETVDEALNGMERLEHSCEVFLKAKAMGKLTTLPDGELEWLYQKRKDLGNKIL